MWAYTPWNMMFLFSQITYSKWKYLTKLQITQISSHAGNLEFPDAPSVAVPEQPLAGLKWSHSHNSESPLTATIEFHVITCGMVTSQISLPRAWWKLRGLREPPKVLLSVVHDRFREIWDPGEAWHLRLCVFFSCPQTHPEVLMSK